jgi:hypothetical protein
MERRLTKEIDKALWLYERFGLACMSDPESGRLLLELLELIGSSDTAMLQSGVVSACAGCAASGVSGSCCFREMDESFGFMELFVNLLLRSELPKEADFPGSCHFVGESGCKLISRQSFCLNYFCPDLINSLGEKAILRIQQQVRKQLLKSWELECALTKYWFGRMKEEG